MQIGLTRQWREDDRNVCRLHELTSKCILGMGGCWTDMETVRRIMEMDIKE